MGAGGGLTPPRTYWEKMQAVLRKYDMLFIADEVICGFGRTGNMWGSQTYDLQPDMISCAKALSAGDAADLGAADQSARVRGDAGRKPQARQFRAWLHLCRAIRSPPRWRWKRCASTRRWTCWATSSSVGPYMQQAWRTFADHPLVGDVRGVGMLTGMEMVADKATRTPFDPGARVGACDRHARSTG